MNGIIEVLTHSGWVEVMTSPIVEGVTLSKKDIEETLDGLTNGNNFALWDDTKGVKINLNNVLGIRFQVLE